MPSPRNHRRGLEEKNRRRILCEKTSSFQGKIAEEMASRLRRPKTAPELLSSRNAVAEISSPSDKLQRLTKLLLNVTIHGSVGAVHVLMSPEATVADLVTASIQQYSKERRRPILPGTDPANFDLHYSQFSLESLERDEKLGALGSRNFFLCRKKAAIESVSKASTTASSSACRKQAESATNSGGFSCLTFVDFSFQPNSLAM